MMLRAIKVSRSAKNGTPRRKVGCGARSLSRTFTLSSPGSVFLPPSAVEHTRNTPQPSLPPNSSLPLLYSRLRYGGTLYCPTECLFSPLWLGAFRGSSTKDGLEGMNRLARSDAEVCFASWRVGSCSPQRCGTRAIREKPPRICKKKKKEAGMNCHIS